MKKLFFLFFLFIAFKFQAQQVKLNTTSCNSNLAALGSNFFCTTNGSQQYRFKIMLGSNTWIFTPGLNLDNTPKIHTNLITAGVNPQYTTTYNVQVDYMISGVWQNNWGQICTVTTPPISLIQLEPAYCNSSLATIYTPFVAQSLSGGTSWKFRVTNTVDGTQSVLVKGASYGNTTNRRTTNINQVATLGIGNLTAISQAIYQVECAISIQGGVFTNYSTICNVTINQSLSPTIVSSDCGVEHNYIFQDSLNAVPPTISTGCSYQFRLIDQSNNDTLFSAVLTLPRVRIFDVPGFAYGKTYKTSVKCIRQGIGMTDSYYGPSCILYTENNPYTKIQDGQFGTLDNCGTTITTSNARVYAFAIPGALKYYFEIIDGNSSYCCIKNTVRNFRFNEVAYLCSAVVPNHDYKVIVKVDMGSGWGPFNDTCIVHTSSSFVTTACNSTVCVPAKISNEQSDDISESDFLQIKIYPNPSDRNFNVLFDDEGLSEYVELKLYDISGKVVFLDKVNHDILNNYVFGETLDNGLYRLFISDNNGVMKSFNLLKTD